MIKRTWLAFGLVVAVAISLALSDCAIAAEPDSPKTAEKHFTLGTPQYIQEKASQETFTLVVPVEVQKPEYFEKPGLKLAYIIFDQPINTPPNDLKADENSIVLNTSEKGEKDLTWQVRSADQSIVGQAHFFMGAPQYKVVGSRGVFRFGLRGFPDKDIGLFVMDKMQPNSNVVMFRKSDFKVGDGDATFQAAVAKIPADDQSGQKPQQ